MRTCAAFLMLAAALLSATGARAAPAEPYIPEAMPPGFRVETSELDGPVFADPKGRTLYRWPYRTMRNGVTGDGKGESNCADIASTESAGLMSPYPGGLLLPDLEKRPSCEQMWPPVLAADKRQAGWQVDGGPAPRRTQAMGIRRSRPVHVRSRPAPGRRTGR